MIRAFRLLRASLSAWYYELFILLAVNIAWMALSLLIPVCVGVLFGATGNNVVWLALSLLVLPLGPATAGLFYVCNEVAKGEPLSFGLFWVGMKKRLGLSVKLAAVIVALSLALIVNIIFYLNMGSTIGQIIGIIWIYAIILWGLLLNYPFALLVQMDKPGLLKILRNSVLLVLDNVKFSVSMSLLTLLIIGLSIFPLGLLPFLLGFFPLLAIFQCKCVLQLIEKYEPKKGEPAASA